ncbi:PREDICTED: probable esterase KAI2 [Camelina sativa]|uniref:Probable esterase KAI2 n=1 Tax=Camelina sativa TaxID=90675 RepID=A0ABM0ZBT7_CAMSA|nr:PREDICTED: probable esterase KAI2 [Camelina sativa]XP_010513488.1 PREDICTED: probable esterase KAI2 [Camelina sativa]
MVVNQKISSLASAMNAKIIGSGEKSMVLAHGFGGDQSIWDKMIPVLSESFKVLVFDWLFSGTVKDQTLYDPSKYNSFDAFSDDLIALMEELEFGPVVFVGHSMSGMVGCAASIKRPDLFTNILLIGASPRYINCEDYEGGFESKDIDTIISNIESNYEAWAVAFSSIVVDSRDSVSVQRFEKCLKKMKPETALALAKIVFGSDERELLGQVSVPCHVIQTGNDVVVPLSVAYFMQEKIKGKTTVEIIEDAIGHFPQMTSHLQLLGVMRRLLGF